MTTTDVIPDKYRNSAQNLSKVLAAEVKPTNYDSLKRHVIDPEATKIMHNRINGFIMARTGLTLPDFMEKHESLCPEKRLAMQFLYQNSTQDEIRLCLNENSLGIMLVTQEASENPNIKNGFCLEAYENHLFAPQKKFDTAEPAFPLCTAEEFVRYYAETLPPALAKVCLIAMVGI